MMMKQTARERHWRATISRLFAVASFICVQSGAANAETAYVVCRAPNGSGFKVDIISDSMTVVFHGDTTETFVDGQKAPAEMSEANDGCTEFVQITDGKYAWGYNCNNNMTYSASIDRYTGAYIREINGGDWGRGDCERISGRPQM